ncbi:hypothetical protein J8281_02030 [Aquimarina sp. U1-2]|uniref:hypothetical protein n=1 Tax=Aquimarina sp. U1-2 TaxID=2823141 RepID=UPI001AECFB96|nr:hypothetical protein [Aquimarina sp. U1-2]MBP2830952.1 hypothetical protein [Aquimarina sp. U1-2]
MKKMIKSLNLIILIGCIVSCSSDDKTVDIILDQVTSGGVLRTIDIDNNMIYNNLTTQFEEDANYILTIEEQDKEGGELLKEVDIFVSFIDNTRVDTNGDNKIDENDVNLTTEEALFKTLTPSDFQPGERGVPISIITFTAEELIAFTEVAEGSIQGKDDFKLRFALELTDGRTFSVDDANGNVSGGSYFSSPYTYRTTIGCTITETLAGTYDYEVISLTSAPGGLSNCSETTFPTGQVTWSETDDRGKYKTTDISFGQFNNCYTETFERIDFSDGSVVWDCTKLIADGEIVAEQDNGDEKEFTYVYTITEISEANITLDFSNSEGDRGTVVLTRPDNKIWPELFEAQED